MRKAVLYARVSTEEQREDLQFIGMRSYCDTHGFEVVGQYSDKISGVVAERPHLEQAILHAALEPGTIFLVWRLDRLVRSVAQLMTLVQRFKEQQISLVSVQEMLDTESPMGRFSLQIIGAIAELEREIIRTRVRAGMQAARERGRCIGRRMDGEKYGEFVYRTSPGGDLYGDKILHIAEALGVSVSTVKRWRKLA